MNPSDVNPSDMNPSSDFDRRLAVWLDDQAPMREPDGLTYAVLARTRHTRRMPRWANPERWLSMTVITRPALAPPVRFAWLLLIAVLALALAAGGAIVASRLLTPVSPAEDLRATYAIPQGGEAVLAFDTWLGDPASGQTAGDIFTVRADGTGLRQLTSDPGIQSNVAWSPDGSRIAYRDWQDGSVVTMDAGGGTRKILGNTGPVNPDCAGGLAWSPDGSSLLYPVAVTCGGRSDLYIVPSDGVSPGSRLVAPDISSASGVWSPDGKQIAFVGRDEATADHLTTSGTGLYIVDVGRRALTGDLAARRITASGPDAPAYWLTPQWSQDGTELAAVAGAQNTCATMASGTMDIYAVRVDGQGQRLLAGEPVDEFGPTWSPDGKQLAFQRQVDRDEWWNGRPCTYRTWILDVATGAERQLDEIGGDIFPPLWSPDGTRLVGLLAGSAPEEYHMYVVTIDGSSPLVTLPDFGSASWQPLAVPLPPAPSFPAPSSAP